LDFDLEPVVQIAGGKFGAPDAELQFEARHRPVVHERSFAQVHERPQPKRHDGYEAGHPQKA
jgi:hypothetical protein